MDNGRGSRENRSSSIVSRSKGGGSSMPSSPLWQNTQAGDEHGHTTKPENRPMDTRPSHNGSFKSTADDLLLLPPASLNYNGHNETVKHPSGSAQDPRPRVDGKTNGVRMVLNRRLSGLVNSTSNNSTHPTGQDTPSQLRAAANGSHARTAPSLSHPEQDMMLGSAASSARTPGTRTQGSSGLVAKPSTDDIQQESRSKGMLSGLHRKGSKLLRRARGASRSDSELPDTGAPPIFSPILPTLPSSPPAPITLSPIFPPYSPNAAMSSPRVGASLKGASMTNLSIPESVSAPSSPRVSGSRTPIMSPKASKRLDELMKAFMTLDKDHERYIVRFST